MAKLSKPSSENDFEEPKNQEEEEEVNEEEDQEELETVARTTCSDDDDEVAGEAVEPNSESTEDEAKSEGDDDEENFASCNIFDGTWVRDDRLTLYPGGTYPFIDEEFDCQKNGRNDTDFLRWRWQPNGCTIPRFDGKRFLDILRGKRLVFVGDSLNRNMWESLVCTLRDSVINKTKVFEASGLMEFKTQGSYSIIFEDYKL